MALLIGIGEVAELIQELLLVFKLLLVPQLLHVQPLRLNLLLFDKHLLILRKFALGRVAGELLLWEQVLAGLLVQILVQVQIQIFSILYLMFKRTYSILLSFISQPLPKLPPFQLQSLLNVFLFQPFFFIFQLFLQLLFLPLISFSLFLFIILLVFSFRLTLIKIQGHLEFSIQVLPYF